MTDHDPLCFWVIAGPTGICICDRLAKVRADERERIGNALAREEAEAQEQMKHPWNDWAYESGRRDAFDLAEQIARNDA